MNWDNVLDDYVGPAVCLLLFALPLFGSIIGGIVLIALHFCGVKIR